jgi:protein ImuB
MYWIYFEFPQLALDLLMRERGSQEALAIHHNKQITQANLAAKQLGIYLGCSLNTAYQLAPQLQVFQQQQSQCSHYFAQLAQQALAYSPQVASHPDFGLFISGAGMDGIYPKPSLHLEQLTQHYQQQQLSMRFAYANTPLAARWLARAPQLNPADSVSTPLAELNLSLSDLPSQQVASLQAMGLYTIKQLCALPRPELRKRLGEHCLSLLDQALGQQATPLDFIKAAHVYSRRFPLQADTHSVQGLMFALKQACQDFQHWLRQRQLSSNLLRLDFAFRGKPQQSLPIKSARLLQTSQDWLALLALKLEAVKLPAAVQEFSLHCHALYPLGQDVNSLFEAPPSKGDQLLFDQLHTRLGEDVVHRLNCHADYRPEYASRYSSLAQHTPQDYPLQFARPCWLLPQLKPIDIRRYTLLSQAERIASGWWDGHGINRDYYMAQSPDQGLAWVCQENQQWFLHGWFS